VHLKHDIYQCNNGLILISHDLDVATTSKVAHMLLCSTVLPINSKALLDGPAFMLNMANVERVPQLGTLKQ